VRRPFAAIAVVAALAVGACGGSDDKNVKLAVTTPKPGALVKGHVVRIAGKATAGAEVKVADKTTFQSPDWPSRDHWLYRLKVRTGPNLVRITAAKKGYRPASVALRFRGSAQSGTERIGPKQVSIGVTPGKPPVKRGAARFSPRQAAAYQSAQSFCARGGERRLARKYHSASSHGFDIAQAYSRTWPQWAKEAVFEGCLSGFGDRG
jgi:hypothetical protein